MLSVFYIFHENWILQKNFQQVAKPSLTIAVLMGSVPISNLMGNQQEIPGL